MNEVIIYETAEHQAQVEVRFEGETFWLTQLQIAELFQRDRTVIAQHLRNVFKDGELDEKLVCAKFAHATSHGTIKGKTQKTETTYSNLDAIISVGYRVNSKRGTLVLTDHISCTGLPSCPTIYRFRRPLVTFCKVLRLTPEGKQPIPYL